MNFDIARNSYPQWQYKRHHFPGIRACSGSTSDLQDSSDDERCLSEPSAKQRGMDMTILLGFTYVCLIFNVPCISLLRSSGVTCSEHFYTNYFRDLQGNRFTYKKFDFCDGNLFRLKTPESSRISILNLDFFLNEWLPAFPYPSLGQRASLASSIQSFLCCWETAFVASKTHCAMSKCRFLRASRCTGSQPRNLLLSSPHLQLTPKTRLQKVTQCPNVLERNANKLSQVVAMYTVERAQVSTCP